MTASTVKFSVVVLDFQVSDKDGSVVNSSANVTVNPVNDAPVLAKTSFTVNEDNSIVITKESLLANASDVDDTDTHTDTLNITNITTTDGHGTITTNDDGDWIYTPSTNFSGDAKLTISVNDGTVTADYDADVSVTPDADAPSLTVSLGNMAIAEFNESSISGGVLSGGWQTDNADGRVEANQDSVYGVADNRGLVLELERNVGDESNIYKYLDINAGDTIRVSFDIAHRSNAGSDTSQVDFYFEGVLIDSIIPNTGWETHTYLLTATTDNPRFELDAPIHDGVGTVLDTINITRSFAEDIPVPLIITNSLIDTDGSETMQSISIEQIPDGALITDGTNTFLATADNTSVDVKNWDLSSLTLIVSLASPEKLVLGV